MKRFRQLLFVALASSSAMGGQKGYSALSGTESTLLLYLQKFISVDTMATVVVPDLSDADYKKLVSKALTGVS